MSHAPIIHQAAHIMFTPTLAPAIVGRLRCERAQCSTQRSNCARTNGSESIFPLRCEIVGAPVNIWIPARASDSWNLASSSWRDSCWCVA